MALVHWAPMLPALEEFDKFFEDFGGLSRGSNFVPALDVYQTKDAVVVEIPLAGVDPDKVNISIENDVLTIEGSTEHQTEVDEKNYYRKEV
ncbi:MAG: Hsp20/alpha crystallin family protein, partial [Candidatus Veblenbacteria bacterium]|nr:Hsp20/alpha crystallin family protein [Candidatus Veblenbacteria bacterium]